MADQLSKLSSGSGRPKEDNFVVLDVSSDAVRAILGIHETLRRPTVDVPSRVALRLPRNQSAPSPRDYLVGPALEEAERSGESIEVIWPLAVGEYHDDLSKGKGRQVDGVRDWAGLEALLGYVLFTALGLPARPLAFHLHLALPANLTLTTHELITQMCFERLHLPALILTERPLCSLFAVNAQHGVVIDIGRKSTEINVVHDSLLHHASAMRAHVGREDLDNYLCHLMLAAQPTLPEQLSPGHPLPPDQLHAALLSIVRVLREGNCLHFASAALSLNVAADGSRLDDETETVDDDALDDVAKALVSGQAAALLGRNVTNMGKPAVTTSGEHVSMPNPLNPSAPQISIGPERHRFAEPLFDPSLLRAVSGLGVTYDQVELDRRAVSVPEAVAMAVKTMDIRERPGIWEHVVVHGTGSAKGVPAAVMQGLAGYVGAYVTKPKLSKVPDWFPEFKDRLDLASFLGASIVARVGFMDSSGQHWINKQDFSTGGPSIVSRIESVEA